MNVLYYELSILLILCHSIITIQFIQRAHHNHHLQYHTQQQHYANPVTADSNNLRGDVTEQEAFLWFDEAMVFVRAGSGGAGSNAVKFGKGRQHVAPSGGNGGNGGNVIFTVDSSFNTLLAFRGNANYRAENGLPGDLEYSNGLCGQDTIVAVPKGTIIRDNCTNLIIGELTEENQQVTVARGGNGGRGNASLKSKGEKSGLPCTPPEGGQRVWLKLELKLVADIGLVGVPNAGKSTLLDAITNARPKIASYAFTTIVPNLGVCEVNGGYATGGEGMVIADIPGLLEGAHNGVGLGRGFLRHVERCKMIIHIINGDSIDPVGDFKAINRELRLFSPTLAVKPQVVVLNKIDIPHVNDKKQELMQALLNEMPHTRLLAISAAGRLGTDELVNKTYKFLKKIQSDEASSSSASTTANAGSSSNGSNVIDAATVNDGDVVAGVEMKVIGVNHVELRGAVLTQLIEENDSNYYGSVDRFEALIDALNIIPLMKTKLMVLDNNKQYYRVDRYIKVDLMSAISVRDGITFYVDSNFNRIVRKLEDGMKV